MARLMGGAELSESWSAPRSPNNFARRTWGSTVLWVVGTLLVVLVSMTSMLSVGNERREVERLRRQTLGIQSELKALNAELRVRMRMPQLQRWNDNVLGLVPISATQYLVNPLHLANYGKPIEQAEGLPKAQLAVRDVLQVPAAEVKPQLVSAPVEKRAEVQRPQPAIANAPMARPDIVVARREPQTVAAELAPAELLREMELAFNQSGGAP